MHYFLENVGRLENIYTKPLLKLVTEKLWKVFVEGEFFVVPSKEQIEKLFVKHRDEKKYNLTRTQVLSIIRHHKEEIKATIEIYNKLKLKFKPAVWGQPMFDTTKKILAFIVQRYPGSFSKNPFRAIMTLHKQMSEEAKNEGNVDLTPDKIWTIANNNRKRLVQECKLRRK